MRSAADQQHMAWLARSFGRPDYAPLTGADLEILIGSAELISKYPGTHLFREGDPALAAFLVESGDVEIYRGTGSTRRVVSRVGSGSVLGDIAMFGDGPYISSAQAVDRVRVFRFDKDKLLPELAKHPAICLRWLVAGLRQLEATQRRVIHLMHKTVLSQVADLLGEEADAKGEVRLSQITIATLLGVSRQSVNEALGRLRKQGAVETGYRQIRVTDPDRLETIATS
ncbi:MAG: Crp/Fnr family transcriptional regulator [Acidobacteria bacterium]|nr:Crp/Fnr family transcriptional regulator [Acidobacteriota bacterium]MCZ6662738.1 Crp/Fnr family transcriptional regulator [Actinomycetota bacterium]